MEAWTRHIAQVRHVGHAGPGRWAAAWSRRTPPGWQAVASGDADGRWASEEEARAAMVEPPVERARPVRERREVRQVGLFGATP